MLLSPVHPRGVCSCAHSECFPLLQQIILAGHSGATHSQQGPEDLLNNFAAHLHACAKSVTSVPSIFHRLFLPKED